MLCGCQELGKTGKRPAVAEGLLLGPCCCGSSTKALITEDHQEDADQL